MPDRARRACLLIIAAGLGLMLLLSCAGAGLAQAWLPGANLPLGYTVFMCLRATSQPRVEVSLSWSLPQLMSSLIPSAPWRTGCAWLPWLPLLPASGYLRFPP